MSVEYQLRSLLSNRTIWESLLESVSYIKKNRDIKPKAITDIHDAEIYRNTRSPDDSKEDVIVLKASVNIDGGSMHGTTRFSLWPILFLINELPQKLRLKTTILAAVLLTCCEPNFHLMNSFVGSFLQQIDGFMNQGMLFFDKLQRKSYRIFLKPIIFAVDTVARPILQARKQYNAHHGCSWCYAFGEKIGSMRFFKKHGTPLRSQEVYLDDLKKRKHVKRGKNGEKVYRGVRGNSRIAELLPDLDNIWGYPPEYMHGVCLGVSKQFWGFLNDSR
ncbi:hypothetical protein QAD02_002173 [Eretmocerus hayati]|uniref:Uncharacterized protein n=1 Tax=Eretmocerus hayati TaxID=131215 RepID=A0ACC2NI50_9HYME|nr:hypothetical protein QAD02_002173 [Eretmocerus hayati]